MQSSEARTVRNREGKYLTFALGGECYAVPVLKVREIIRLVEITPVPQMPAYVKGVINLRGKVIPVIDLRVKFDLAEAQMRDRTCIVVVQVAVEEGGESLMGLIVDAVEEVLNVAPGDVEDAPEFGARVDTHCILGIAKGNGRVRTLLDIDRAVSAEVLRKD